MKFPIVDKDTSQDSAPFKIQPTLEHALLLGSKDDVFKEYHNVQAIESCKNQLDEAKQDIVVQGIKKDLEAIKTSIKEH